MVDHHSYYNAEIREYLGHLVFWEKRSYEDLDDLEREKLGCLILKDNPVDGFIDCVIEAKDAGMDIIHTLMHGILTHQREDEEDAIEKFRVAISEHYKDVINELLENAHAEKEAEERFEHRCQKGRNRPETTLKYI